MSDQPIATRLQVKGDRLLAVSGAPESVDRAIGVPERRVPVEAAAIVLVFVRDKAALGATLPDLLGRISAEAILWLAYPKLSSPLAGDLNRDIIRALVPAWGLDPVSQIAIDDDWSALRLKRIG